MIRIFNFVEWNQLIVAFAVWLQSDYLTISKTVVASDGHWAGIAISKIPISSL